MMRVERQLQKQRDPEEMLGHGGILRMPPSRD
jgi:hypothetical protein